MIETDVLIVGSGPAGSSSALFLSTYGVENMVITKYRWTANTPRAHITNQRAVEAMRDMGLEGEVAEKGTPQHLMGDTVFCTSLAGEELARLRTWGTHPQRLAEYTLASPCTHYDLPQDLFEPIILGAAARRGSRVRFDAEYLSHVQDDDGVTVDVLDRLSGQTFQVRCKYLIGADGGRSKIAEDIGLPMEGVMDWAGSMNVVFHADLTKYVEHRPSVLYWILQPGAEIGGIGMGVIRMVRPWTEWLLIWGYDIAGERPVVDEAMATRLVHDLVGDDTVEVTLRSTSLWGNNKMFARRYVSGRVYCMGDACHRHPPSNGLGSNTSIGDAYNLAWKLAYVLQGKAGASLLESYDAERAPIGEQIVLRANQSIQEFGPIFESLGLLETNDPEQMRANMEVRKEDSPAGAEARRKLRAAIELKNYEFNAHGVELNQRYRAEAAAVVPDGTPEPEFTRDADLHYHPTTWPGARLPHVWLERDGAKVSVHDLCGKGRFTLLTGVGGEAWAEAARAVGARLGIEIAAFVIGPGRDVHDTYDDWSRMREVEESGCLLVRPDVHVGWRSATLVEDPEAALGDVLGRLLGVREAVS